LVWERANLDVKAIVEESLRTFTNLLKEFPRQATDEFVYDASTLKKIDRAAAALTQMAGLCTPDSTSIGGAQADIVRESHAVLSRLMSELPRAAADEFLYDRRIHRLVEDARMTLVRLNAL